MSEGMKELQRKLYEIQELGKAVSEAPQSFWEEVARNAASSLENPPNTRRYSTNDEKEGE